MLLDGMLCWIHGGIRYRAYFHLMIKLTRSVGHRHLSLSHDRSGCIIPPASIVLTSEELLAGE